VRRVALSCRPLFAGGERLTTQFTQQAVRAPNA
jgi:hypothetical protein